MKTSEVFRRAQKKLMNGDQSFICHAISRVRGCKDSDRRHAKEIVMGRLYPFGNAMTWVRSNLYLDHEKHQDFYAAKDLHREWRILWLDNLIAEFEAKGD